MRLQRCQLPGLVVERILIQRVVVLHAGNVDEAIVRRGQNAVSFGFWRLQDADFIK